jgi:hypothetical protein
MIFGPAHEIIGGKGHFFPSCGVTDRNAKCVPGIETHTKRQATQHGFLPSLLGDGDKGIKGTQE